MRQCTNTVKGILFSWIRKAEVALVILLTGSWNLKLLIAISIGVWDIRS